jgi:hypothetical protein
MAPRILNLGTRWGKLSVLRPGRFTPRGKSLQYPLDKRLDGPQSRSGGSGEEKISLSRPCRESNPGRPDLCLVTILAELLRLSSETSSLRFTAVRSVMHFFVLL